MNAPIRALCTVSRDTIRGLVALGLLSLIHI